MDKSYVGMEQKICSICGVKYDTGAILLDKRLKPTLEQYTVTGVGTCSSCEEQSGKDFIACIVIDPERSEVPMNGERVDHSKVYRTGKMVWIRRRAFKALFGRDEQSKAVYIPEEVFERLEKLQKEIENENPQESETAPDSAGQGTE